VPQPQGDDLRLEGREPPVFTGDRTTTDAFIHELKLYQFLNSDHPLIANDATRIAHALTYIRGPAVAEWRRAQEDALMTDPFPFWDDFEDQFTRDWHDVNETYRAAARLDNLTMSRDDIDEYITQFATLARKALYREDDPAVLEKFKRGLPLRLLENCMSYDEPQTWNDWKISSRQRQASAVGRATPTHSFTPE
jgi:Retrotransposon gag protein